MYAQAVIAFLSILLLETWLQLIRYCSYTYRYLPFKPAFMKLINILIFLLLVTFASCQSKPKQVEKDYELIADDDGILAEKFDSTIVDENRYNHNNIIYKVGNSFKYKFEHITTNDEIKFYRVKEDRNSWEFVDFENSDSTSIKSVVIEVANGNPMAEHVPDYNQTALLYKCGTDKGFSMSGAIENEANVWIHPPRDKYFRILELNPFPYIISLSFDSDR